MNIINLLISYTNSIKKKLALYLSLKTNKKKTNFGGYSKIND